MKGRAWKFGDNVNTDEIIPARYLNTTDQRALAEHCMEDADPQFAGKVRAGDFIVAGENFGCGSSREHAPIAIKAAGVACVIAGSFARIFLRNAINTGLAILESPEAAAAIEKGEEMDVDLASGRIRRLRAREEFRVDPFPKEIRQIIQAGGLMNFVKQQADGGKTACADT